jgi:DTW domain-containing protein YfiP
MVMDWEHEDDEFKNDVLSAVRQLQLERYRARKRATEALHGARVAMCALDIVDDPEAVDALEKWRAEYDERMFGEF